MKIPVIGVFHNELNHLAGWLSSVEQQHSDNVDPFPVVIVSPHPEQMRSFEDLLDGYICSGRLAKDNKFILDWNRGPTAAFNVCAQKFADQHRCFPWIASLDPDARFAPGAISQMLNVATENKIGMVSPLIIKSRRCDDFQSPVSDDECVCHAGHFPHFPKRYSKIVTNYWRSHFSNMKVSEVQKLLESKSNFRPFSACFCASLWNSQMFSEIGLPDIRQFRTLNCGEIGYRAQLYGWTGQFAPKAFAFHPKSQADEYEQSAAMKKFGCTGWHYFHAQGLIALRYFPDQYRNIAAKVGNDFVAWENRFGDLIGIVPEVCDNLRKAVFDRWDDFKV